jgi:hypothetical protein
MSTILNNLFKNPLVLIVLILFFAHLCSRRVEFFTMGKTILTEDEYKQEIRVLASYVGPYLGNCYQFLQSKYSDPSTGTFMPLMFQPGGVNDPTLADPALSVYRAHIKSFLGSAKLRMSKKYGQEFLDKYKRQYDIDYEQTGDRVLKLWYTMDGETQTFYL